MSYEQERLTLYERFFTLWEGMTPVAVENYPFNPPNDVPWVKLNILNDVATRTSLGSSPRYRFGGLVSAQIFTPQGSGTKIGRGLADIIDLIFRDKQLPMENGSILCRTPSVKTIGVTDDGWYQINVNVPFLRDQRT